MDLGIRGRTALVLTGGGGLGSAIARALAQEGVDVALAGRSAARLEATAEAVRREGVRALPVVWDLAAVDLVDDRVSLIEAALGPVDILVNITGGPPPTPAAAQPTSLWAAEFQAMVLSVIAVTDRVLPGMRARGWGRIITSLSSGVLSPIPNLGISNSLRSSLLGWSKTLAREMGPDGVTLNVVVPGRIATGRVTALDERAAIREGRSVEAIARDSASSIALGRYGKPEEYASMVVFLASEQAAYVTGSVIRVDGGLIPGV